MASRMNSAVIYLESCPNARNSQALGFVDVTETSHERSKDAICFAYNVRSLNLVKHIVLTKMGMPCIVRATGVIEFRFLARGIV